MRGLERPRHFWHRNPNHARLVVPPYPQRSRPLPFTAADQPLLFLLRDGEAPCTIRFSQAGPPECLELRPSMIWHP